MALEGLGGFLGAFSGSAIGGAVVRLLLDTRSYEQGLVRAEASLSTHATAMGAKASSLGKTIGTGLLVAAPLAAVAAGKLTLDFENAFTRISALSNVTEDDIDSMKDSVLDLAGETGRGPEELADALFFLASAGLKANEVMPALEVSAKAAAVGLGETADIANIVASALNAYADSGLTAAQVTDTLVAAVREGRAEPDAFADSLGRVLPIAAAARVEFDEVAASLAALSNIGLDVDEGVTALRGLLQAIVAPTAQAKEEMDKLGISSGELRDILAEDGLLGALELLNERSGGNIDSLRELIPNVRALTGELGLQGKNAQQVAGIFDRVKGSTGALAAAMEATAKGPGFALSQILATIQSILIEFGQRVLPIVLFGLKAVAGPLKLMAENLELVAAALALVLRQRIAAFFSAFAFRAGLVVRNLKLLVAGLGGLAAAAGIAGIALVGTAGVVAGIKVMGEAAEASEQRIRTLTEALRDNKVTVEEVEASIDRLQGTLDRGISFAAGRGPGGSVDQQIGEMSTALERFNENADGTRTHLNAAGDAVRNFANLTDNQLEKFIESATDDFHRLFGTLDGFDAKWKQSGNNLVRQTERMAKQAAIFAEDLQQLEDLGVPEAFSRWLIDQGPGAVHGFVESTRRGRNQIVENFNSLRGSLDNAETNLDNIATAADGITTAVENIPSQKDIRINIFTAYSESGNIPPGISAYIRNQINAALNT